MLVRCCLILFVFNFATALGICIAQSSPDQLLLKNYRPQSIYKIPITEGRKHNIPVIDMHSHAYPMSEKKLVLWVQTLKNLNIEKTIILSGATGVLFDSIYNVYAKYDCFEIWCGFDYTGVGSSAWPASGIAELERCYKKGARGIGELGDKGYGEMYSRPVKVPGIHIDDLKLRPLLEKCASLKMPVSVHVAEPQWMYEKMDSTNDGFMNSFIWKVDTTATGFKNHKALINTLENAVHDNPATTFIACHFANCESDLTVIGDLLDKYSNLYADVSARFGETAPIPRYMKKFYQRHAGKLLYGTDMGMEPSMYQTTFRILETDDEHFYETELFNYHWPCNGFDLDKKVLGKLYYRNALKILKR
jgi:predicted TIM-barrel fold metal-dependent hydrolase